MATQAELRQAVGTLIDDLGPYTPRTVVAGVCTATSIVSGDLQNLPADTTLLAGGYFLKADGTQTYVQGPFTQSAGSVTVVAGSVPVVGDTLEYWKTFRPTEVNSAIKSAWNELRRKLWTPTIQVWTVRDLFRRLYTLPESWSHLSLVSWGQALSAGGISGQPNQSIPTGVPGPGLIDFQNVNDVIANTQVGQGLTFTGDTWIRYVAVYLKRGSATEGLVGGVTLTVQSDAAGFPSGTGLVNATQAHNDLPIMPQWVVFDFGTPYRFLAGTRYHIVLSSTLAVAPADAVAWARTADTTTYAGGQMSLYNGAAWSHPGYNGLFLTFREQGGWIDMEASEWGIRADRQLDLRDYQVIAQSSRSRMMIVPDGTLIRLEGERFPAQPTDFTQLELPYDYLLNKVAYDLVKGHIKSGGFDPDDWADRLRDWKSSFEEAQSVSILRRPQNSRRILDASPGLVTNDGLLYDIGTYA